MRAQNGLPWQGVRALSEVREGGDAVTQKQFRAHVNATLARWGQRLVKDGCVPYLLLGLREAEGGSECILCCGHETRAQIAGVLRQALAQLELQIFDAAYRGGGEGVEG
jgi:hypothetical protein